MSYFNNIRNECAEKNLAKFREEKRFFLWDVEELINLYYLYLFRMAAYKMGAELRNRRNKQTWFQKIWIIKSTKKFRDIIQVHN